MTEREREREGGTQKEKGEGEGGNKKEREEKEREKYTNISPSSHWNPILYLGCPLYSDWIHCWPLLMHSANGTMNIP
jgi:hypothetical protein